MRQQNPSPPSLSWTPEAEARLGRAPPLLQDMVRKLTDRRARAQGVTLVDEAFLEKTRAHVMAAGSKGGTADWTREALERLEQIPGFLRDAVRQIAEEAAGEQGAALVTVALLDRLEKEAEAAGPVRESLPWTDGAMALLEKRLSGLPAGKAGTPAMARDFVRETLMLELEAQAKRQGLEAVDEAGLRGIWEGVKQKPVTWDPEARARLERAPEFVRQGIRKAAEKRARILGIPRISSELLTQFRNAAMMKAVRRIRRLGFQELTFEAFDKATETTPRLRSPEARKRLQDIRDYMAQRGDIHLLDAELMARFRKYLEGEGEL